MTKTKINMKPSIAEIFRDGTILITGSTGFLGKTLVEKLLRSCPAKNIVILVRHKKGLTPNQRVAGIYKQTIFDKLRIEKPDFMNYIKIINGDLSESSIGLKSTDRNWLIENVDFVFHCAATVRFNETLENATRINVLGTENLLVLASQMKNLKGFVHVSTAYSHSPRNDIGEQCYPIPITAKELTNMLSGNDLTNSNISANWPNTYTFTKAITENLILTNENHLPISIFRPSIIGPSKCEPEPGWVENMNGLTGIITALIVGFLRVIPADLNKICDMVPVDYTANALISVMWDTVNGYQESNQIDNMPKVYNYVSSVDSPLNWGRVRNEIYESYYQAPPLEPLWYIFCIFSNKTWVIGISRFLLHRIPALIMDLLLIVSGKNSKMSKMYEKTEHMTDLLHAFTSRQWKFENNNINELWSLLSQEDRREFWFCLEAFEWKSYMKHLVLGIKKHILHEDLNDTKALAKNRKLFLLHHSCIVLLIYFICRACWVLLKFV